MKIRSTEVPETTLALFCLVAIAATCIFVIGADGAKDIALTAIGAIGGYMSKEAAKS